MVELHRYRKQVLLWREKYVYCQCCLSWLTKQTGLHAMTTWYDNVFYIIGPLWGASTGPRLIPFTMGQSCKSSIYSGFFVITYTQGYVLLCFREVTSKYIYLCSSRCFTGTGKHYSHVIMGVMASQIPGVSIVYSTGLFRCKSKKKSKLRVTGLCEENSPVTGELPAPSARNAENVSIWWGHHEYMIALVPANRTCTMLIKLSLLNHNKTQESSDCCV